MGKYLAKVKISIPSEVSAKVSAYGGSAHPGAVYCECPELGFEGANLIYCRYGLSVPFIKVQNNDTLWIEPRIGEDEGWIYTGMADCAGRVTPSDADQMVIQLLSQVIYASTSGTMHLSNKAANQAFLKSTELLAELQKHATAISALQTAMNNWVVVPTDGGAALKTAITSFLALPMPSYTSALLSTKIFGE